MNENNEEQQEETPSLFKMIRTFGKELTEYIKQGAPNVTPEDYAIRLDTCMKCDKLIKQSMRCGACGCKLEYKARWRTSDCQENKWPEQKQLSPKELQDRKNEG